MGRISPAFTDSGLLAAAAAGGAAGDPADARIASSLESALSIADAIAGLLQWGPVPEPLCACLQVMHRIY